MLVVKLFIEIHDSGGINCSINRKLSLELSCVCVEVERSWKTLRGHQVASSECFYFVSLQGSVGVVESFSSITSGGGQVLVGFEFPVGPSNKFLVSDVGNLLNLLSARAFG